jgi:hypothetical protein
VLVTWDSVENGGVTNGGRIEVYWRSQSSQSWTAGASIPGDQQFAYIYGAEVGDTILIRARARNSLGMPGPYAYIVHLVAGDDGPPEDVTNLDWEIKPGQVVITCDPCIAADYAATELRYMETVPDYDSGDWAAATFLVRGASNEYHHPRPPNGTYYVLAKHRDTSGNYSENPAYITVVVDDSIDAGTGGSISLTTDRFPFFSFADGTTHTASGIGSGTITITAHLFALFGTVTMTAEAFDAADASLGSVTLGGTGNARTITAAQFVAAGTSGSVRTVVVTGTLGIASDSLVIYRQDSTTTAPRLYLSNPKASVATDEAGEFGDYSDAQTDVYVFEALTETTDDYTISITPDSGVSATINGGAGPVSGTLAVTVAVTAMTIPDGAVFISATDGGAPLTASFYVTKNEASGAGYSAYFEPRAEIILPVGADGDVSSYTEAWSNLKIIKGGSVDDTAQWSLSKVDTNVTSTLTGAKVQITEFLGLGELGSAVTTSANSASAGWDRPSGVVIRGDDEWIMLGYVTSGTWQKVKRSTDYATWTDIDVGVAGRWEIGAFDQGAYVLIERGVGSTNKTMRSTDGGLTWSNAVTLAVSSQWYNIAAGGGKIIATSQVSTTACYSTNGGSTWSTYTYPVTSMTNYYGAGYWLSRDTTDTVRISINAGATWTTVSSLPYIANHAIGFLGRLVVAFRGSSTKVAYTEDGSTFTIVTVPYSYSSGQLMVISGVLYLLGAKLQYSTDGILWRSTGDSLPVYLGAVTPSAMDIDFIPLIEPIGGNVGYSPLTSTSDGIGFVTVTATKAGELDITRSLPVRKGSAAADVYTAYAAPAYLLLPATSDGVVTSYAGANISAHISKNGIDDTANWSWTYTTTHLTPSSGSSNSVTITAMDDAEDLGQISFVASKAGQANISGTLNVAKSKGSEPSGPKIGGAYHVIEFTDTFLGLMFRGDGTFDVKRGSGGSYAIAGQWAGAVLASNATTYWIRVEESSTTGSSLSTGTTGTWLAMTSDREYTLSDASSGTHKVDLTVMFGTSSGGADAIVGFGSLQLVVP